MNKVRIHFRGQTIIIFCSGTHLMKDLEMNYKPMRVVSFRKLKVTGTHHFKCVSSCLQ